MQHLFTLLAIISLLLIDGCAFLSNSNEDLKTPTSPSIRVTPTLIVPSATSEITPIVSSPTSLVLGTEGNGHSYKPTLSLDGRYVVFESTADNLVAVDTNGATDIFIRDRQTNQTERINVAINGLQTEDDSHSPTISADGQSVAFSSWDGNLVPGDTFRCGSDHKSCLDVFVYDRKTGVIELVSRATNGDHAKGPSESPAISANGRYIIFASHASNLFTGDINGVRDVFLHDRQTNQTELISKARDGSQANGTSSSPSISADGRFIVFWSAATDLTVEGLKGVFIHDRLSGTTEWVGDGVDPGISAEGNRIAFLTVGPQVATRLVIYDRETGVGKQDVDLSIGFEGRELGITHLSSDGRWVTFSSLAEGRSQVFVYDYEGNESQLISTTIQGMPGNDTSWDATISGDGNMVVFSSNASDLIVNDINQVADIFLYNRLTGRIERVSMPSGISP